ncbi:MAG: GNAT family N-acetyltransferase [Woeseia sp.]
MVAADLNNKKIAIDIRAARAADLDAIVALDAEQTGTAKTRYWTEALERFTSRTQGNRRYFLVGKAPDDQLLGFIVGEIRAWEFGSPPCGWVLALNVTPGHRERGIGTMLFDALCAELKRDGVTTIRTMVLASDRVNLSFFRGEGLAAGPYIELERQLD